MPSSPDSIPREQFREAPAFSRRTWYRHRTRYGFLSEADENLQIQTAFELTRPKPYAARESRETEIVRYAVPLSETFRVALSHYPSVSIDPNVMAGAPCIAGTRIPVYMILDVIEAEGSVEAVLASYPRLTLQQVKDAIGFSKLVVECPIEYETGPSPR